LQDNGRKLRLCVGASSGGHMVELRGLLAFAEFWPQKPDMVVTTQDILAGSFPEIGTSYVVGECNRNTPLKMIVTALKATYFVLRYRPDIVISTGALPIAMVAMIAKKLRSAKIVWIDSIAQIEELSMSGKWVIEHCDLFLVQWPELAQKHEKAVYVGELQ
jgi:hypothetical protein